MAYKRIRFGSILGKDRILMFGDDAVTARVLGKVLKRQGYVFDSIKEHTDINRHVWEYHPKLVILNYNLSDDNLRLCRNLKSDKRISHIPVIILSSPTSTKDVVKGLKAGADDYLFKPINKDLFLAKMMAILRRRIYHEEPEEILSSRDIVLNLTTHKSKQQRSEISTKRVCFALFLDEAERARVK